MSYAYYTESYESKLFYDLKKSINAVLADLPEYCASFFQDMADAGKKNRTILCYLLDMKTFFYYIKQSHTDFSDVALKDIPVSFLATLEPEDIESYLFWLENYSMDGEVFRNSSHGKRRKLTSLRSFFMFLNKRRYIRSNPAILVDLPGQASKRQQAFTVEQRNDLCAYLQNLLDDALDSAQEEFDKEEKKRKKRVLMKPYFIRRDIAIMELLFLGKLKLYEMLALDVDDIDLSAKQITVYDSDATAKKIGFDESTRLALNEYLENARTFLSPNAHNDRALFISAKHTRISARAVERIIKTYTTDLFGEDTYFTPYGLSESDKEMY